MSAEQYHNLIKQDLDPNCFERLFTNFLAHASLGHFKPAQVVFAQQKMPNKIELLIAHCSLLIAGQVEISYVDEHGNYLIIEKYGEGFWFGNAGYLDGKIFTYTAKALTDVMVLSLSDGTKVTTSA